jgi:hypothetical protein
MDNEWSGYLQVGREQYFTLEAPDFPKFGALYVTSFAKEMCDVGRNAYLIARSYATIGKAIGAVDIGDLRIEAGFHDQDDPIIFNEGCNPEFNRISDAVRRHELDEDAEARINEMLKHCSPYLTNENQRKGIAAIARIGGKAGAYGGGLKKSGGIDYVYLENRPATDKEVRWLQYFPGLDQITLGSTNVTDAGISALSKLKNLRALFLFNTRVSTRAVAKLQRALPKLKIHHYEADKKDNVQEYVRGVVQEVWAGIARQPGISNSTKRFAEEMLGKQAESKRNK